MAEGDRIRSLGIWGPGEYVGTSISARYRCQLEGLTDVIVEPVSPMAIEHSTVLNRYVEQMETVIEILSERQVRGRLIRLFKWLEVKFSAPSEDWITTQVPLTHQDIAELIGTSREAVTRELKVFEDNGEIECRDKLRRFKSEVQHPEQSC